jgi:hypothetical protein
VDNFELGGGAHLLKFVVLPLNALMLKDNLAEGASDAKTQSAVPTQRVAEAEAEVKGFKDIL